MSLGGGTKSTTTVVTNIPPKTKEEIEAQKLALEQLRSQKEFSDKFQPLIDEQLQAYIDEQRVRGGGKVIDVMKKTGAPKEKTLDEITTGLTAQFTNTKTKKVDEAGLKAAAEKAFKAQAASEVADPTATAARQKFYQDIIDREAEGVKRGDRQAEIQTQAAEEQLATMKRGGAATPEQLTSINAATTAALATGEADINRFRQDTLRQINEEIASASGLRPTDTPVVRLSERAGEEAARQHGMLVSRLAETNATARLNFPLAQSKLVSDIATNQQSLGQASQQFQEMLKQRAADNRFRLFQSNPVNTFSSSPSAFANSLASERFGLASRTTNTDTAGGLNLAGFGQLAGGIGGLLGGVRVFSDRRLKRDIYHIGELPSGIPVYLFRFIGYEDWHVGAMADEVVGVVPEAVSADESGFMLVDYSMLH